MQSGNQPPVQAHRVKEPVTAAVLHHVIPLLRNLVRAMVVPAVPHNVITVAHHVQAHVQAVAEGAVAHLPVPVAVKGRV